MGHSISKGAAPEIYPLKRKKMANNNHFLPVPCYEIEKYEGKKETVRQKSRTLKKPEFLRDCLLLTYQGQKSLFPDRSHFYEFAISDNSFNILGRSVSIISSENWQVPTFLWPPPLYFNIRLPTSRVQVLFKML